MGAEKGGSTPAAASAAPFPPTVSADPPARQPGRASAMAPPFVADPESEPPLVPPEWLRTESEPATGEASSRERETHTGVVADAGEARAEPGETSVLEPDRTAADVREAGHSAPWRIPIDASMGTPSADDTLAVGHFVDAGQAQPVFSHPDDEPDTAADAHRLADRLETVGRRLRMEGDAALRDLMAHGDPFDVAIAAVLMAYLAPRP